MARLRVGRAVEVALAGCRPHDAISTVGSQLFGESHGPEEMDSREMDRPTGRQKKWTPEK